MTDPQLPPSDAPLGTREHLRRAVASAQQTVLATRAERETTRALLARTASLLDGGGRALQRSLALRAQLRASVTAYVRALRAEQTPPQRALVLVKTAVQEAPPPALDADEARALMDDVVRWCVEAYYESA